MKGRTRKGKKGHKHSKKNKQNGVAKHREEGNIQREKKGKRKKGGKKKQIKNERSRHTHTFHPCNNFKVDDEINYEVK